MWKRHKTKSARVGVKGLHGKIKQPELDIAKKNKLQNAPEKIALTDSFQIRSLKLGTGQAF
jgi:hypothetical protein